MEYIVIQYRDGCLEGDDLADAWEQLTETAAGIQFAARYVPKRSGSGHKACGVLGVTREEAAEAEAQRVAEQDERDRRAIERMHAARGWTWTAPNTDSHL